MENLGKEARDKITGFKGIITAKCFHLYGCSQYALNPPVNEKGETGTVNWFDEGRIEIIGVGISPSEVKVEKNGCDNQIHP